MLDASYTQVPFDSLADLPEPIQTAHHPQIIEAQQGADDSYLKGLNKFINDIGKHVSLIQDKDLGSTMQKYVMSIDQDQPQDEDDGDNKEEQKRRDYKLQLKNVQKRRKHYRNLIKDASEQRQLFLDSCLQRKQEECFTNAKINRLHITEHKLEEARAKTVFDLFSTVVILFQCVLILIYVVATDWRKDSTGNHGYYRDNVPLRADDLYTYLIHIMIMITFGFGYLNAWLKRYGFSAVGYNFLLVGFVMELSILTQLVWRQIHLNPSSSWDAADLTISTLVDAAYVAATVSVSWSVIAGKVNIVELLVFAVFEVMFYGLNYYVNIFNLEAVDNGGAMTIHLFGAMFGLAASFWLSKPWNSNELRPYVDTQNSSTYHTELITLVATLFTWALWPSFNAATAPDGTQHRAIVNTFVGLIGSTVFAFFASRTINRKHFQMRDIQNATLIGAIALGSCHSIIITPGAAIVVGCVAGAASVLAFNLFQPWLERKFPFRVYDTRGACNVHGLGGIIGGIASAIAAGSSETKLYGQVATDVFPHGLPNQGGYQAGCLFISFGIALGGGFITGLFIWVTRRWLNRRPPSIFTDHNEWVVPVGYQGDKSTGTIPEP